MGARFARDGRAKRAVDTFHVTVINTRRVLVITICEYLFEALAMLGLLEGVIVVG